MKNRSSRFYEGQKAEYNNGKSMTVPNQALTIKDIMARYVSGQGLGEVPKSEYSDEEDQDIRTMDISEVYDKYESLKERFAGEAEEKRKQHREKYDNEVIERYLAARKEEETSDSSSDSQLQ